MANDLSIRAHAVSWPLKEPFSISRGVKTQADVVQVAIRSGEAIGRGEAVPYARYGESMVSVLGCIEAFVRHFPSDMDATGLHAELQHMLAAGAARNALDCALWDLRAKQLGTPVWQLAGISAPRPVITAYTISLASSEQMFKVAQRECNRPVLKIKLGHGKEDITRLKAVRRAAPDARLIVDANEGWPAEFLAEMFQTCAELKVALIEQPLPAKDDHILADIHRPVPICADESCHLAHDLSSLQNRYEAVNVKLDKAGGFTEALSITRKAQQLGFQVMIGCMVGSSLAMAPAMLLAECAAYVDLDGPLLLANDMQPALTVSDSVIAPPPAALWG